MVKLHIILFVSIQDNVYSCLGSFINSVFDWGKWNKIFYYIDFGMHNFIEQQYKKGGLYLITSRSSAKKIELREMWLSSYDRLILVEKYLFESVGHILPNCLSFCSLLILQFDFFSIYFHSNTSCRFTILFYSFVIEEF